MKIFPIKMKLRLSRLEKMWIQWRLLFFQKILRYIMIILRSIMKTMYQKRPQRLIMIIRKSLMLYFRNSSNWVNQFKWYQIISRSFQVVHQHLKLAILMDNLIVHLVQPVRVPQIIQGEQRIQLIIFKVLTYKRQLITLEILEYLQVNQVIYMDNIIKD